MLCCVELCESAVSKCQTDFGVEAVHFSVAGMYLFVAGEN